MTTNDAFERRLGAWLEDDSALRVPDHLDAVLVRTAATRQRSAWSSLERWLPVDHALSPRRVGSRPRAVLVVVGALLAVLAATLLVGTGRPTTPIPLRAAGNGRILVADGAAIRSYAPDGTDGRTLLDVPDGATYLAASPDGRLLAVGVESSPERLDIVDVSDGSSTTIRTPGTFRTGDQVAWSPASDRIVMPGFDGTREAVLIASIADGTARVLGDGVIPSDLGIWWPTFSPDGDTIAFIGVDNDARTSAIHLIAQDGSGHRILETGTLGEEPFPARWSPDPSVKRLLYTAATEPLTIHLLDVASGEDRLIDDTFWPTWSPTGDRISYWGTFVAAIDDVLAGNAERITAIAPWPDGKSCQEHPELRDQHWCGPAEFSPDGTRLIAADITGTSILSVMADGTGQPIVIPLQTATGGLPTGAVAWQPIRP